MADYKRALLRVVLTITVILASVLVTIVTSQSIGPWPLPNETHWENSTLSDVDTQHDRSESEASFPGLSLGDDLQERHSSLLMAQILGMLQGYRLGQELHQRYQSFLGSQTNFNEVNIRSADIHRTIINAECVGAGLFPATFPRDTWPLGRWQPVPIHTFPLDQDTVLSPSTVCKYVDELRNGLLALHSSKQKLLKNKNLMFHLSLHTDMEMNVKTLHQLSDNIYSLKVHNMTLPSWLSKEMEEELIAHHFNRPPFLEEQARYLAGMLLQEMLSNIHKRIDDEQDNHKMYLYSGHDLNVHALMSLLQVYNDGQAPHASALVFIIELYQQDNQHFIKLIYKVDDSPFKTLIAPGCVDILCPLDKFEKLYGESIQEDWDQVCGEERPERFIDFGELTVPILMFVLVFLLVMDIVLLYKACVYHRKLQQRPFKDDYTLVQTQNDNDSDDEGEEMDVLSNNSNHHSHTQNGGSTINYFKKGRKEDNNRNHKDDRYSDSETSSDEDSHEETTLFMSPHKTKRGGQIGLSNLN